MLSTVGIMSCAHGAWIASSKTMGDTLAAAVGDGAYSNVHTPVDKSGFLACLGEAKYIIIHTHGCPDGLFDQRVFTVSMLLQLFTTFSSTFSRRRRAF